MSATKKNRAQQQLAKNANTKKPDPKPIQKSAPTDAALKAAFAFWREGDRSVWAVKRHTKIKAKVLIPFFMEHGTAVEKKALATGPTAHAPKTAKARSGKKEAANAA